MTKGVVNMLEIGDRVKDKVTGDIGTVAGYRADELSGKMSVMVLSTVYFNPRARTRPESQLEKVESNDKRGDGG